MLARPLAPPPPTLGKPAEGDGRLGGGVEAALHQARAAQPLYARWPREGCLHEANEASREGRGGSPPRANSPRQGPGGTGCRNC